MNAPDETHLVCHRCGCTLTPGEGNFYVVRIAAAVFTGAGPASATRGYSLAIDGAYTTVQVQAKTPTAAGQLIWNSTLSDLCVSTGTTVEGYKLARSASTTCQ